MHYNAATQSYFDTAPCVGELSGTGVGRGAAGNRAHGAWVQFSVRLTAPPAPGAALIEEARFLAYGCPHLIAAAARVCERATGGAALPALPESLESLKERFEMPTPKMGRLLLIEDAWIAAVAAATGARGESGVGG
jgi:NifU-like protein involved in Fe-S cluster formation